jgi:NitT/TauT family transport system substrate-binding protein
MFRSILWGPLFAFVVATEPASAQAVLKLAVGAPGSWETSIPEIGQNAGIFKKHGLQLEVLYSQGGGETLQAVISGSVDIGIGTGLPGVLNAFSKGAPIRIIANECTGSSDFWYVAGDSKFRTLADPDIKTIAFSTVGSSTQSAAKGLAAKFGSKAKLVATGGPAATLTQVMSKQVDVGWSAAPLGIKEVDEGKIRIIARGSELPGMDNQTIRVVTTNANMLQTRASDIARFLAAYQETVDWMYTDPKALDLYADIAKTAPAIAKRVRDEFVPKSYLLPFRSDGIVAGMKDAIDLGFISAPLSEDQLRQLVHINKP